MNRTSAVSFFLFASGLFAQQQPATELPETLIRANVHEVLLDVVVRQKNHQLARKLKASDFTITEDGAPQVIKTFRLVTGKDTDPPPQPVSAPAGAPLSTSLATPSVRKVEEPAFVSIVFEELGPESRAYARNAALEFLKNELRSNTYVAIFGLDTTLHRLQDFSNDRTLLASAVEKAAISNYSSQVVNSLQVPNQLDYQVISNAGGVSVTSTTDPARTPDMATGDASTVIGNPAAVIESKQREVAMYMTGMRTVDALLALVKYEAKLPGRKTILYMCEGLNLPPGQRERIFNVISSANHSNVSFYGIDARGLLIGNPDGLARNLAQSNAATSFRRQTSRSTAADESNAKQDDTQFVMGVANTQQNLQELSERTGGFAIMDTNEIGKQMIQVMEDVRTHYEITYTPASSAYDGRFRKIAVTTSNAKLDVQSRDGYYALPDLNGHSLDYFEMTALQALSTKTPSAFPLHLAAMRFDPFTKAVRYEIAFELAAENVTMKVEPSTHQTRIHATFLALIKDPEGNVVDKVSRDIDQLVPDDKVELFRRGEIIFSMPIVLSPGHYTVEGVALDAEGNRAGTRRIALSVAPPLGVGVSDVALVHAFQALTSPRDTSDPLQFSGGRVTPELNATLPAADGASLYFVLYPGAGAKPQVTVDFYREGASFAETHPQLTETDDMNSIPVVTSANLPPGDYQARVTVEESGRVVHKWTAFTVSP